MSRIQDRDWTEKAVLYTLIAGNKLEDAKQLFDTSMPILRIALAADAETLKRFQIHYKTCLDEIGIPHGRGVLGSSTPFELLTKADQLFEAGELILAKAQYEEARIKVEKERGLHNTLRYTILHNLALCNAALGDYTKARALLKAVMDDEQKYLGPSSIFLAWTLCSLAKVDLEEGTPDAVKAINSTYDRVIELLETANLDETSPETCQAMMGISNFFLKIGRYSDAEQLLHQLLTINEKRPDSPVVAHARELLGRCYLEEGKIKEARVELNQVLKILEAIHKNTFLTLPQTASIWNELGRSYVLEANEAKNSAQRTRLALEAVRLLRKALELQTRSVGQQHRDIIYTTRNLAQAYELAGNHAQAMHYLKQALTVGESIAPDHPVHAETLALSANLYLNRGDYDKAENEAVEALRILSRNISVNSRTINEVLVLLGIIELKHGIPESQVRRHILLLFKQKLGEDNPITAYWRKVCSTPTPAKGPKQKATPHISR